jgi:hypothetical protein
VELALHDHRIERAAAVVHGHVPLKAQLARLDVDLDGAGVCAERPGDGLGPEERARVQAGRALAQERGASERRARQPADVDRALGHAGHVRPTAG